MSEQGGRGLGKWNTPIYNALREYADSRPAVFHMPGHRLGKGIPGEVLESLAALDVTEIPGMDNLHAPEGVILEAQRLAARAFGAEESFFLVNGSTGGIHAMIMTVCKPGDRLIVSRDCHRSVIHGMMLAGIEPVYVLPEQERVFGITAALRPEEIEKALQENSDAAGVLITRPNYYGICPDIRRIADIVHASGKILMVDEAHGTHLKFSPKLPVCAMEAGADLCVQSAHKTLPSFTQTAYLHVKSGRVDRERLRFCLGMLQTTSPSYVFMAMLDIIREMMERQGEALLDRLLDEIGQFREAVRQFDKFMLLGREYLSGAEMDSTRVVINTKRLGRTGFDAELYLRKEFGVQVEMSDLYNIVCIATVANTGKDFERLLSGLTGLAAGGGSAADFPEVETGMPAVPQRKMELSAAMQKSGRRLELKNAAGKTSKGMITPYPPGIPVVCPGEEISDGVIDYIYSIIKAGGKVNGVGENFEVSVIE